MFTFMILAVIGCQFANAKSINDNTDKIKALEEKCYVLQNKQVKTDNNLLMAMKSLVCSDRNITMVCNFKQDSFQTKVYQKASV